MRIASFSRQICTAFTKNATSTKVYQTPEQILSDGKIQAVLSETGIDVNDQLPTTEIRIKILQHLSSTHGVPIPSNVYTTLSSPSAIAEWYSNQLRPKSARSHVRKLIHHTLGNTNDENILENLDKRIDLERETVQEDLEARLPSNLKLDDRIYMAPTTDWEKGQRAIYMKKNWRKIHGKQ